VAILYAEEIRDMTPAERSVELEELETELLNVRAVEATGGAPDNPGRMGELSRTIARIKTIQREEGDFGESEEADAEEASS
jgi:large subunit ribosomal protein L29